MQFPEENLSLKSEQAGQTGRRVYETPRLQSGKVFEPVMVHTGDCLTASSGPGSCEGEHRAECS